MGENNNLKKDIERFETRIVPVDTSDSAPQDIVLAALQKNYPPELIEKACATERSSPARHGCNITVQNESSSVNIHRLRSTSRTTAQGSTRKCTTVQLNMGRGTTRLDTSPSKVNSSSESQSSTGHVQGS